MEAVQKLPDNATVGEAMERLYFLAKVECGLEEAKAGREVSHEEIRRRFAKRISFGGPRGPRMTDAASREPVLIQREQPRRPKAVRTCCTSPTTQ